MHYAHGHMSSCMLHIACACSEHATRTGMRHNARRQAQVRAGERRPGYPPGRVARLWPASLACEKKKKSPSCPVQCPVPGPRLACSREDQAAGRQSTIITGRVLTCLRQRSVWHVHDASSIIDTDCHGIVTACSWSDSVVGSPSGTIPLGLFHRWVDDQVYVVQIAAEGSHVLYGYTVVPKFIFGRISMAYARRVRNREKCSLQ
jgi:hypothetical protein